MLLVSHWPDVPVKLNPDANTTNSEGTTGRMLEYGIHGIDGMTVSKCTSACQGLNYILAGVEYSGECCKFRVMAMGGRQGSNSAGRLR